MEIEGPPPRALSFVLGKEQAERKKTSSWGWSHRTRALTSGCRPKDLSHRPHDPRPSAPQLTAAVRHHPDDHPPEPLRDTHISI